MTNHPNRSKRARGIHGSSMAPREVRELLAPRMTHVYNGVDASITYAVNPADNTVPNWNRLWHTGRCETVSECVEKISEELKARGADLPRSIRRGDWTHQSHAWHDIDYAPCPHGMLAIYISQQVDEPALDVMAGVDGYSPRTK